MIVLVILFCGCSEKVVRATATATEASLEQAVSDAAKVFEAGDTEAIANLFIPQKKQPREQLVEFAKGIAKSEPPLKFKFESCKVSGNMGIVLLSFSREDSYFPYFAEWNDGKWKFYLDFLAWQSRSETRKLDLTEREMEDALVLQKWAFDQPFAGASGINAHDRLAWYVPYVPKDLKIELFYETPSPAMDHEYMWKIKLEETEEFKKFAVQFLKPPPNVDEVNDVSDVAVFDAHPDWWRAIKFDDHKVYQYRVVTVVPDSSVPRESRERGYLFGVFDKEKGCLYVQAF